MTAAPARPALTLQVCQFDGIQKRKLGRFDVGSAAMRKERFPEAMHAGQARPGGSGRAGEERRGALHQRGCVRREVSCRQSRDLTQHHAPRQHMEVSGLIAGGWGCTPRGGEV